MATQQTTSTLYVQECVNCGVSFGMPKRLHDNRREEGGDFYCPHGHVMAYRETEIMRLKRQLARKQELLEKSRTELRASRLQASAQKGVATRLRKRVAAGVCPCCNRTFKQLERHMKTQHTE